MLSTILMRITNKAKYQYSLRLERPLKTAYFFNASTNQLILSSSCDLLWDVRCACGRRILAPGICSQFCGECVLQQGPQRLTQRTSVGDDAEHEALLRRSTQKYRPGRRSRRDVQVRSCSPLRRQPLLRQAIPQARRAGSVAGAEGRRRKAAEDRPDHRETP